MLFSCMYMCTLVVMFEDYLMKSAVVLCCSITYSLEPRDFVEPEISALGTLASQHSLDLLISKWTICLVLSHLIVTSFKYTESRIS